MKTATSALEAAQFLIWLALHEEPDEPVYLTPMQLQKLLYYVQGWGLAEFGMPIFKEKIQAWRDGPVVREVYDEFKDCGKRPIIMEELPAPQLTPDERQVVRDVWDRYKGLSALALREMTHEEEPWIAARGGKSPDAQSTKEIPKAALERFFRKRFEESQGRFESRWERIRQRAVSNTRRLTGREAI